MLMIGALFFVLGAVALHLTVLLTDLEAARPLPVPQAQVLAASAAQQGLAQGLLIAAEHFGALHAEPHAIVISARCAPGPCAVPGHRPVYLVRSESADPDLRIIATACVPNAVAPCVQTGVWQAAVLDHHGSVSDPTTGACQPGAC